MTKKRRINTKYIHIIDGLKEAARKSEVNTVVLTELVGITYITMDKYLRKERFVNDEVIAKRMVVATQLLNELVDLGKLPIPPETSSRLRSGVIMDVINTHIKQEN